MRKLAFISLLVLSACHGGHTEDVQPSALQVELSADHQKELALLNTDIQKSKKIALEAAYQKAAASMSLADIQAFEVLLH